MSNSSRVLTELFATASLGAPENAVGFVMWRVVHRYLRELDRALAALDMTHLQFMTLVIAAWLGRSGNPVTQAELARFGNIQAMQVSQVLKTLENKGMVIRPRSTSDVRAKRVEITPAGVKVLRRALPVVIDVQRRLFGREGEAGGSLLKTLLRLES